MLSYWVRLSLTLSLNFRLKKTQRVNYTATDAQSQEWEGNN